MPIRSSDYPRPVPPGQRDPLLGGSTDTRSTPPSEHIEQATAAPGEKRELVWRDVDLGVISWDSRVDAYVLRIKRRSDLPLSFNVWTKTADGE